MPTTVTTQQELRDAIAVSEPEITVANDIALTQPNTINYDLELTSNGSVLTWEGAVNGKMFSVISGATLTISSITLDGLGKYATLVYVAASTLIMNEGAILKSVKSNTSNTAVTIGTLANLSIGGNLVMNSGLITDVQMDSVVSCSGGSVTMNGNASISNNQALGIGLTQGTLTMTGNAEIAGNVTNRTGMGVLASDSIINMGIAEGDAPRIADNESLDSYSGGLFLASGTTMTMNYGAAVTGNKAVSLAGGIGMNNAVLNMLGNSSVSGNITATGGGGGIFASGGSVVTITDQAVVSGNSASDTAGRGGGIYLQQDGTTLNLSGEAAVFGNQANDGAGVYVNTGTTFNMGTDEADTPSVSGNQALTSGGGIYISTGAEADIAGHSVIADNTAGTSGQGIYNAGSMCICQHAQVTDGLYFNSADNVPEVRESLTETAAIQLEESDYVSTRNLPILVGNKGPTCADFQANDQNAFLAPAALRTSVAPAVSEQRDQVLLNMVITLTNVTFTIKKKSRD